MQTLFQGIIFDMDGTITKPVLDFGVSHGRAGANSLRAGFVIWRVAVAAKLL